MVTLVNRAKMSTSTTGTGTITLGSASSGYQSFADAGVADGDVVRYVVEDGTAWEVGYGTYTASGTTLTRNVMESSNADAALNLSGSATVFVGAAAEDVPNGTPATAVTPSSGTYTLNLAENTVFYVGAAISSSSTVALSNVPSTASYAGRFEFPYGGAAITWPASFQWETGVAPTIDYGKDYVARFSINTDDNTKIKANLDGPYPYTGGPLTPRLVGYASASGAGSATTSISLTALTGGIASAPSEGDIVVVCAHQASITVPAMSTSGYTTAASGSANDTEDSGLLVAYKFMGASPDTTAILAANANAADGRTAIAFVFRDVDATTPLDVTPTVSQVINTVLADPPSITTATGGKGAVLLGIGGGGHSAGNQTYSDSLAEYTTFFSLGINATNDSTLGVGYVGVVSNGTTYDPSAFSFSGSDNVAYSNVAVSLVLRGTV